MADYAARAAEADQRRSVVFVAAPGTVSDALIFALEKEFPWIVAERVDRIAAACVGFEQPVSLILLEASLLKDAELASPILSQLHPDAFMALLIEDSRKPGCPLAEIFGSKLIQGVLPMNLKLDVWLSIVRLMLQGGGYYPTEMLHERARASSAADFTSSARPAVDDASVLTQREIEILELVSRGLQNKSIATELGLSEHTVKIHLHNIISKLRAHNRTGAAAWFRDYQARKLMLGTDT